MDIKNHFSVLSIAFLTLFLVACEMAIPPFGPIDRPDDGQLPPPVEAPDTIGWNIPSEAITVAEARAICAELESGATTGTKYYVMGYVKKIHNNHASGITGFQNTTGKIENCINYGTITGGGFKAAGICGETKGGSVTGCVNYGNVTGTQYTGGIVGLNAAALSNCDNYGSVTQTSSERAGGIVGHTSVAISNCNNYGTIKGKNYVAGIAGYATAAISNCENFANVSAGQWVGGIVGRSTKNITNCVNHGDVTGTADFVGGIVGASDGTTRTLKNCVNNGAVKGVGYIGGIDGRPYAGTATYDSCINNGSVTATYTSVDRGSAGGIVGRTDVAKGILINCQSNGNVTAKSAGAYIGLNNTTDTTGYVIYDSCSTTFTGNAIGYDKTLAAGVPLAGFAYTKSKE